MRTWKKLAAFAAAALTLCPALGMNAGAATTVYDDCDVDHSGYVDIADVVATSRYLIGDLYASDYNRFDTNKSMTVDYTDIRKIYATMYGDTYKARFWSRAGLTGFVFPSISGFTPDAYANATTTRWYKKYTFSTHQTSEYYLNPTSNVLTSSSSQTQSTNELFIGIVGYDNRVPSAGAENTGIVRVGGGSGFIIGDHLIATAAHCVYGKTAQTFVDDLQITSYNADGTLSTTVLHPVEAHIPSLFSSTNEPLDVQYDYALVTVTENLSSYMHFNVGTSYNLSESNYANVPIYMIGPGFYEEDEGTAAYYDLYYAEGRITTTDNTLGSPGCVLYYTTDCVGGWSGTPVYTITMQKVGNQTSYYYTALGVEARSVHNGTDTLYNAGARFTKYQMQFYSSDSNTHISW